MSRTQSPLVEGGRSAEAEDRLPPGCRERTTRGYSDRGRFRRYFCAKGFLRLQTRGYDYDLNPGSSSVRSEGCYYLGRLQALPPAARLELRLRAVYQLRASGGGAA